MPLVAGNESCVLLVDEVLRKEFSPIPHSGLNVGRLTCQGSTFYSKESFLVLPWTDTHHPLLKSDKSQTLALEPLYR